MSSFEHSEVGPAETVFRFSGEVSKFVRGRYRFTVWRGEPNLLSVLKIRTQDSVLHRFPFVISKEGNPPRIVAKTPNEEIRGEVLLGKVDQLASKERKAIERFFMNVRRSLRGRRVRSRKSTWLAD